MSGFFKIFKKQGGLKLIKQYTKSGTLFTAISQFIVLGKSKTALEILRLSTQLKIKNKLKKKYYKKIPEYEKKYDENLKHESSNKVWICWFQGMENAPELVQKCYESVQKNLKDKEIILITEKNMMDYVEFPEFIIDKWKSGIITNTHMTDLLRLELLIKYGGLWLDATVFCSSSNIPEYIWNSDLFFYQTLKPGKDGHSLINSSWLISAKTNNKILMVVRDLCYEYWKKNNYMIDYFLLHFFISIVLEYYPDEWKKIVPVSNSIPHILLLRLFDEYDEEIWNAANSMTAFHKLTYKFDIEKAKLENTFYRKIIQS